MGKVFELISSIFCVYKHQSTVLFARFTRDGKQVLIWRCKSLNCLTSEVESINLMNMSLPELLALREVLRSVQQKLPLGISNSRKLICKCDKGKNELSSGKVFVVEKYMILYFVLIT